MKKLLLLIGILIATPVMAGGLATLINGYGDKVIVEVNSQDAQEYFGNDYNLYEEEVLGSVASSPALFRTNLASKLTTTGTSMTLVSAETRDGTSLSGSVCFTIDGNLATAEYVCGTASGTSITALERGLGSDGTTEYTALKFPHRYGAEVKITDFPILQRLTNIINGDSDFPNSLTVVGKITATSTAPTADGDLANKKYVDDTAIAGAPDATLTVKGLLEVATGVEMASTTPIGGGGTSAINFYTSTTQGQSWQPFESVSININSDGEISAAMISGIPAVTYLDTITGNRVYNTRDESWGAPITMNVTSDITAERCNIIEYNTHPLFFFSDSSGIGLRWARYDGVAWTGDQLIDGAAEIGYYHPMIVNSIPIVWILFKNCIIYRVQLSEPTAQLCQ